MKRKYQRFTGFEKNGTMMLNFQDTAELEQDSSYLNEAAYPNSAIMAYGKYAMWPFNVYKTR